MNTKSSSMIQSLKHAVLTTLVLLFLCGFLFPVALTGLSKVVFPHQAGGSLIMVDGVAAGAEFVGQDFTDDRFMKCRPSAVNYNTYTQEQKDSGEYGGVASGSNNYAATNPDLTARVQEDMAAFLEANPGVKKEDVSTDLLTASGSGLDPHISPASAEIQIAALATATGLTEERLGEIVAAHTEGKRHGLLGENRVNVLRVNLDIAKELGMVKEIQN